MKFEHYLKRVEESEEFKKFIEEHKKAYLCAGFFVLDYEQGKHVHQVDFFIPTIQKIATFSLEGGKKLQISEPVVKLKKSFEKLDSTTKTDIDALKGIVADEMHNRTITQEIKKMIVVLHAQNGKKIWNLNCITNELGILKVHIDDETSSILEFEKASLFDFVRKV